MNDGASYAHQWKILIFSSLGGAFEFYDFVVFASFATYIGHNFFPAGHASLQLIQTFALFAAGYLVRPLGGFILGHLGDKYGRKKVFVFSISLMGVTTLLIGILPTYTQIGIAAPILLLIIRMIQGFALGGELPGSITFVFEHARRFKGFATGFLFLFINMGLVLGQLVHAILISTLSSAQLTAYGWRFAFILGGVLAITSYFMQRKLDETPVFKKTQNKEAQPLLRLFKSHTTDALAGVFVVSLGAVIVSIMYLFMPSYLFSIHFMTPEKVTYLVLTGLILFSLCNPITGFISDFIGRKAILSIVSVAFILLTFPLYHLLVTHQTTPAITLYLLLSVLAGGIQGTFPCLLSEMFETRIRYTAIATSYNIAFAIFGGLTPLFASIIMKAYPESIGIGWILVIPAFLTLLGILMFSKKAKHQ